jgi:hypothetical protein
MENNPTDGFERSGHGAIWRSAARAASEPRAVGSLLQRFGATPQAVEPRAPPSRKGAGAVDCASRRRAGAAVRHDSPRHADSLDAGGCATEGDARSFRPAGEAHPSACLGGDCRGRAHGPGNDRSAGEIGDDVDCDFGAIERAGCSPVPRAEIPGRGRCAVATARCRALGTATGRQGRHDLDVFAADGSTTSD